MAEELVIMRLPAVLKTRGCSRTTQYREIKEGLFPRPIALGGRSVGWPQHEVRAINAARISGKSDHEIQDIVTSLEAMRKDAA